MISLTLFGLAVCFTLAHLFVRNEWRCPQSAEVFLSYVLFFNMGMMGLLGGYGHIFLGPEIAKQIGWEAGSPFQFEVGMANLAFGVLGILSYWNRGGFWTASIIGWCVLLFGCFVGHIINYYATGNTAPDNIGTFVWFNDLTLPIIVIFTLLYLRLKEVKA
ncbi:MAG: hypothetical protein H7A37_08190 [Chlamydiales bacterium]|nr:hypothetical protein [Chlamydiia bacterium]MCP5508258.1 hypothetical protein [Chlamydiales bacterium]